MVSLFIPQETPHQTQTKNKRARWNAIVRIDGYYRTVHGSLEVEDEVWNIYLNKSQT